MTDTLCCVVISKEAIAELGKAIEPYLSQGTIGPYILCSSAVQNNWFVDIQVMPEHCSGRIGDPMIISVPASTVRFMARGFTTLRQIGFTE